MKQKLPLIALMLFGARGIGDTTQNSGALACLQLAEKVLEIVACRELNGIFVKVSPPCCKRNSALAEAPG